MRPSYSHENGEHRTKYQSRINKLEELGFSQKDIQSFIDCWDDADKIGDQRVRTDRLKEIADALGDLVDLVKTSGAKSLADNLGQDVIILQSKMNG